MKNVFCLIAAAAALVLTADEKLYTDTARSVWRFGTSPRTAARKNKCLLLTDAGEYIHTVVKSCPYGARLCFSVEKTDPGAYRLGFIIHPEGKGTPPLRLMGPEQSGKGNFIADLPVRAARIGLLIQGKGSYQKAALFRLSDPAYRLEAEPPYQLVSGKPQPFSFKLYHRNKEVSGANIRQKGCDAFHPGSGATARAFIDKGDPAPFDAIAKDIKISKPVHILYLGDSLTFFDLGRNHADKTGYFLNKYNPGKVKIWNYACGGDHIRQILKRLRSTGFNRYHDIWSRQYDWAVIFLGHNDTKASSAKQYKEALVPPAQQKKLYEQLIAELRQKGIRRIILFSSTSSNFDICKEKAQKLKGVHNRFGDPLHMEAFNRTLQILAKEHKLEYLDLYTEMKAMPDKDSLTRAQDGVHLTDKGHDYVARKTLEFLKKGQK
ncbi:MAG: SGNH/GDSL hydrolase family protein [Lentisphaeria bacterium]|nr:SGNH/GDSL hydrolase family protein [Lentisphaeria bacterium]